MTRSLKHLIDLVGDGKSSSGSTGDPVSMSGGGAESLINTIRILTSTLERARTEGSRTFSELGRSEQTWSDLAVKATGRVLTVLTQHQRFETTSVAAHSRAEQAKSLATASALKQTAAYKAIEATAAGFQALGSFDFWAAANDFTSAALWGTLAGEQIASMADTTTMGGRPRRGAAGPAHRSSRGGGPGSAGEGSDVGFAMTALGAGAASAAAGPSGHLTVAVMGDNEAGEWLANTLNTAVEQRGVQLTSTRSTRSTYAQG
ncbi:MAG: hypothetical protein ACRD06_02605 [Terriglobia bacterium]